MRWPCPSNAFPEFGAVTIARPVRVLSSLLAFATGWLLVQGIAESLLGPVFSWVSGRVGEPVPFYPFSMVAGAIGGTWAGFAFPDFLAARNGQSRSAVDRLSVAWNDWRPKALMMGTLMGSAAIGVTVLMLWVTGGLRFDMSPTVTGAVMADTWNGVALRMLVILAPAALWEELVYRGFLYDLAISNGSVQKARVVTSAAFGISHLFNPGAGFRTTFIVMLAGWCLVLLREHWGLPAAWLAHLAWNWIMAAVLHVAVSGMPFSTPGYRAVPAGPDWWSGGNWGPEGGIAAALVLGVGAWMGTQFVGSRMRDNEKTFHQESQETQRQL